MAPRNLYVNLFLTDIVEALFVFYFYEKGYAGMGYVLLSSPLHLLLTGIGLEIAFLPQCIHLLLKNFASSIACLLTPTAGCKFAEEPQQMYNISAKQGQPQIKARRSDYHRSRLLDLSAPLTLVSTVS